MKGFSGNARGRFVAGQGIAVQQLRLEMDLAPKEQRTREECERNPLFSLGVVLILPHFKSSET